MIFAHWLRASSLFLVIAGGHGYADTVTESGASEPAMIYYYQVMNAAPLLPASLANQTTVCSLTDKRDGEGFKPSGQINYSQPGWEDRVAADWDFFGKQAENGRILVIDIARQDDQPAYRYLSNNTQNELFEPWSSSKIFAFTGAVAKAREQGVGASATAGQYRLADLITSIHSYEPFGTADGDSNAIATYLANVAGREFLTSLFHDRWLKIDNAKVGFHGAYAVKVLDVNSEYWQDTDKKQAHLPFYTQSSDDPAYLGYRCETCGLTGNKPMTTLAMAEWLKRLAMFERDSVTRMPGLQSEDIPVLFYGRGHSAENQPVGGMMQGISRALSRALASAISGDIVHDDEGAKLILDEATQGQWRVFQKIGWGPSGTRQHGENVMLAHVCLPYYQGGREFTLAAQAAYPGEDELAVGHSGLKMQALLNAGMARLLADGE